MTHGQKNIKLFDCLMETSQGKYFWVSAW